MKKKKKQIRIAGKEEEMSHFRFFAMAEARASWKSTVTERSRHGWVFRVQVSVNTLATWNLRI